MLTERDMAGLEAECRKLPETAVIREEEYVKDDAILVCVSAVLSLHRKWYSTALPARRRFERNVYGPMQPKTLRRFRELMLLGSNNDTDWRALSQFLWSNNEKTKAQALATLADYLLSWQETNAPGLCDIEAMRKWARLVSEDQFVGRIRNLGPAAYQQLLWYLEGKQAIKLDIHISRFVDEAVGRKVPEGAKIQALRQIAARMGIDPTELDARIWDYMQSKRCAEEGQ